MNGRLRLVTDADLDDLLRWRNHPRVRKAMINQHHISRAEHRSWWEKIRTDKSYRFYIYQEQNKPMAVVDYFRLDATDKTGWWGFYLCDYSREKPSEYTSLWNRVEKTAIRHAFEELGLRLLLCETLRSNPAVIFLHKKYGFSESTTPPSTEKADLVVMELKNPHPSPEEKTPSSPKRISVVFLGSANWDIAAQNLGSYAATYPPPPPPPPHFGIASYADSVRPVPGSVERRTVSITSE